MYNCIKCNVTTENTQKQDGNGEKEGMKKGNLTWAIFSFVCAVKWRPPQTTVKNTAVVIQYCISHQNHSFTQRNNKSSLSSAHTTTSKNTVYRATSAEHTHTQDYCFVFWGQDMKVCYIPAGHFNITASSVQHLRPRASCAFVYPPEGGAQDMKNRRGGSYLHPLFQQLFPKLWVSSCFSHHMTSTVMVGFNEQISFRGR